MDFEAIAESDRACLKRWSDISELNYWSRKLGFQKLNKAYKMIEVDIYGS